jgi:hypothetical protein
VKVTLSPDPTPSVKIIGARIARALLSPKLMAIARDQQGSFGMASTTDQQRVTVMLGNDNIHVSSGIVLGTRIVMHLDFNSDAKPRVEGLWRRPVFIAKASQLLEPQNGPWQEAARRFWQLIRHRPRVPTRMLLVCTDSLETLILVQEEPPVEARRDCIEIHGTAKHLAGLFSGDLVLLQAVQKGQIQLVSNMEHACVLTGLTLQHLLGELDGPAACPTTVKAIAETTNESDQHRQAIL